MSTPRELFEKRKGRVRSALKKAANGKMRLSVFRSGKHMYAQIIDDTTGNTLVSASTLDKAIKDKIEFGGNKDAAKEVGKLVAEKAIEAGIKEVVFDRGGYPYSGRVKELAEAAREAGLVF